MEIAVVSKAKHGIIYRYMKEHNLTISELSERIGICSSTLIKIINLHYVPSFRGKSIHLLESFFQTPIDVLFPEELGILIEKGIGKKMLKYHQVELLSLYDDKVRQELTYEPNIDNEIDKNKRDNTIYYLMSTLMPWEEIVLRLRFGIAGGIDLTRPTKKELERQFPRDWKCSLICQPGARKRKKKQGRDIYNIP